MDEPDGVAGVTALQDTEPPLEQRLLALEVSGKLADAAACYERIPPPLKPHHIQVFLLQFHINLYVSEFRIVLNFLNFFWLFISSKSLPEWFPLYLV